MTNKIVILLILFTTAYLLTHCAMKHHSCRLVNMFLCGQVVTKPPNECCVLIVCFFSTATYRLPEACDERLLSYWLRPRGWDQQMGCVMGSRLPVCRQITQTPPGQLEAISEGTRLHVSVAEHALSKPKYVVVF